MSKTMSIQEQWALFQTLVISPDAPDVQRREMQLAFFAGCEAMLRLHWDLIEMEPSEAAAIAIQQGWHDEVRLFAEAFEQAAQRGS